MGYTILMDARKVNASPVPMYSLAGPFKGHMSFKSSLYCPGSASKLSNQYLIEDHMVSHYKKVYSAKAAVDSSVPKSLLSSVKYNDQKKREQLKKDVVRNERQTQSVRSLSQKSTRSDTRLSAAEIIQSHASIQRGEATSPYMGSPMMSTPRFTTSFHSKQIVYASQTDNRIWSPTHRYHSASEFSYRSPNSQRQPSARSCFTSSTHNGYKSFQDPVQKTYSGDLLRKHSHHFTEHKPFTPRTLKTESKSFLSQYRFYTPPRRKPKATWLTHQDTYHGSTHLMRESPEAEWDLLQENSIEHEWSDEESHSFNHSDFGIHTKEHKTRWRNSDLHSSSRVSPEEMKSPVMKRVSAEEEELMYLEFIADVTNDILSRGLYSNRVLERVFARQMEMNKHRLDEDKMRHLLEVLRKDLASSSDSSTTSTELEEKGGSHISIGHLSCLEKGSNSETKDDLNLFSHTVFDKNSEAMENSTLSSSPLVPGNCTSSKDLSVHKHQGEDSEEINSEMNCEMLHFEQKHVTNSESHEETISDNLGQLSEMEDLGRTVAESLCISEDTDPQGVIKDKNEDADHTEGLLSDEEF
ncbi:hypothetical protein AGOR_G00104910 [Albula goreensis]|uniref:Spermatogenesis-associated protein 7 n=1 Tax=Albula goreensis TaxID=1534307 RepID=A0A8T3DHI4_9TELE|nr:hypothetical protein AGOR_G00104910 [Albula goreensis]